MNFNSKAKSLVILVLGLLVCVGAVMAYNGGSPKNVIEGDYIEAGNGSESMVGGITVPIEYFEEGIVEGGLTNEISVAGNASSATTTAMAICQYKNIEYTVAGAAAPANTLHLPTSDALINACLYTENDSWTVYFSNESATAATTTTIAISNGDNMELLEPDGSDVIIPGAEDAILHFRNAGSGIVKTTVTSVRAAD